MAWFKVDDGLPRHHKFRKLRRTHPTKRRDIAPLALWTVAGAWSDDGFIATEELEEWDDNHEEMAARLVDAGLWTPGEKDGEPGFYFHDWEDMNPAATDPMNPHDSGRWGSHKRWHVDRGVTSEDCIHCNPNHRVDRPHDGAHDGPHVGASVGANAIGHDSRPLQPDHTRGYRGAGGDLGRGADTRPSNDPDDDEDRNLFETWWKLYPKKVDKMGCQTEWRNIRATGASQQQIIDATRRYVEELGEPRYASKPVFFLRDRRWLDYTKNTGRQDTWDHYPTQPPADPREDPIP